MNDDRPRYEKEFRTESDFSLLVDPDSLVFLGHVEGVDLWLVRSAQRPARAVVYCSLALFKDIWKWTPDYEEESARIRFLDMMPHDHPAHDIAEAHLMLHQ